MTRAAFGAVCLLLLVTAPASAKQLGRGAWSWFGDPRAVYLKGSVYTGWITRGGRVQIARYRVASGHTQVRTIYRGLGRDDHNNPSLLLRPDGRITAFFSPHSGYTLPPPGIRKAMWFRTTAAPRRIGRWGALRRVHTNSPGPLGWTYPNPIRLTAAHRTWLFWRGGNWQPTFSTSRDGIHWTHARTLLHGPGRNRPYVKYDSNGRDTIDIAFTQAHPSNYRTGIFYARWRHEAVRGADGHLIARTRSLPFRAGRGQVVYRPKVHGRAWVFDVAHGSHGHPVIVYVVFPSPSRPLYRYARWDGRRWRNHDVVRAGPPIVGDYAAGISLDHEDPSTVLLARKVGGDFEVERWHTPDHGRHWTHVPVTKGSSGVNNIRPLTPRRMPGTDVVVWLRGHYPGYRSFLTRVSLRSFPRSPLVDLARAPAS